MKIADIAVRWDTKGSVSMEAILQKQNGMQDNLGTFRAMLPDSITKDSIRHAYVFFDGQDNITGFQFYRYDPDNGARTESYTADGEGFRQVKN